MRLRAPLLESVDQLHPGDKTVEVSYTLDSRPLSTDPLGSVVRVRFEFLDLHGNLVSPNAVAVDLLTYQNGDHHITRIRIEPARGGGDEDRFTQKSRPWVVKYWRTQFGSIFETKAALPTHGSNSAPESPSRSGDSDVTNSASTSGSRSRFPISSFWAASNPAYPNHRSGHYTHGYRPKSSLMQIIRPIILPAVLGAVAGLVACVVGFFVGHLLMSLAIRLGWQGAVRRPRTLSSEEWSSEKSPMVPHIYVANVPGSDV